MRGVIEVCAIKAPGFGSRRKDLLQDIAIATGATYVAEEVCAFLSSSYASLFLSTVSFGRLSLFYFFNYTPHE